MRAAIVIHGSRPMYLAAVYSSSAILTPFRSDACSYRDRMAAEDALAKLRRLGYTPTLEDVAW